MGAEIDLFVPSFPELQAVFGLSPFMVELTIGVNLAAHCLTSLIMGSLGDKYGRKPIILWGLFIFSVGSLICIFSPSYIMLLVGRLLQGLGISAPAVLSYILISDRYSVSKQQELMGIMNGVIGLAMAGAPILGSFISKYFGWRGNFQCLFVLGFLATIFTLIFIPNSKAHKSENADDFNSYLPVLKSKKMWLYVCGICASTQSYWLFIALSPILFMQELGVTLEKFGFYQGSLAGTFAVLSIFSSFFYKAFGQNVCFKAGMLCMKVFVVLCLYLSFVNTTNAYYITALMLVLSIGVIFPINILWPMALESVPEAKGKTASIMVSVRLIVTALVIQLVSHFYNGTFQPLGLAMIVFTTMAIFFIYKISKKENLYS